MIRSTRAPYRNKRLERRAARWFFHAVKKQLTLRLDADVIAWFKDHAPNGEGYQTSINNALRKYVSQHGNE
jgi:uncharacterized protein (DUF4415 family)